MERTLQDEFQSAHFLAGKGPAGYRQTKTIGYVTLKPNCGATVPLYVLRKDTPSRSVLTSSASEASQLADIYRHDRPTNLHGTNNKKEVNILFGDEGQK